MNKLMTGIFLRGVLVGTKRTEKQFTNKSTGELKTTTYTEIGIEVDFENGFGQVQKMIKTARISVEKEKDASFMRSLKDNHMCMVELPVGLGDYRNVYVERDAVLKIIQSALQQIKTA